MSEGFDIDEIAVLTFEGGQFDGATARCRIDFGIGDAIWWQSQVEALRGAGAVAVQEFLRRFGDDVLISWNARQRGEPLPANGEGMVRANQRFVRVLLEQWLRTVMSGGDVPPPLPFSSGSGSTSDPERPTPKPATPSRSRARSRARS